MRFLPGRSNFSVLTLPDSETQHLIAFLVKFSIFGQNFRSLLTPRGGVKIVIFEESFYTLLDSHLNIICAKFQDSNPYQFRKLAFGSIFSQI